MSILGATIPSTQDIEACQFLAEAKSIAYKLIIMAKQQMPWSWSRGKIIGALLNIYGTISHKLG
jgi:hypothetical protein